MIFDIVSKDLWVKYPQQLHSTYRLFEPHLTCFSSCVDLLYKHINRKFYLLAVLILGGVLGFGILKRWFRFFRASYMTRIKVEAQLRLKSTCFNLLKAVNMVRFA